MYTYTMRNDTATNECFVGLIVNDEEIYIKEAGDHCIRNIDPKKQGMRLYKKGKRSYEMLYLMHSYFCLIFHFMVNSMIDLYTRTYR